MDTRTAQAAITTTKTSFAFHRNATFIALLVGYAGYYLCRQNFSVAYAPMKEALGIDAMVFGSISSFGTLMYALGKVTTGALSDTRGGRSIFFLGLAGSVVASLLFSLGTGVAFFFVAWGVNRLFQSMGWGGLVNVMARWFPPRTYGTAMGLMSINYQFGGVIASVFAGLLLSMGMGWRALFVVPALTLAAIGLATRLFLVNSPSDVGYDLPHDPGFEGKGLGVGTDERLSYLARFRVILADRMFWVMCALSFVLTLLRECFNLWMPAYFSDMGASASAAAFKSSVFPLLGCAGTLFAGWFSDRFLEGRRGPVMGALLLFLTASLLALGHLEVVSAWTGLDRGTAAVALVGITGFFLLGPYSLVGGVVALDFGGRRTSGTAAGLLDGVGYLGATAAGYGVAALVVARGWSYAYSVMAALAVVGVGLCVFLWGVRPKE